MIDFGQSYGDFNYQINHNGHVIKKNIISSIYDAIENNDFWPCYYSSNVRHDEFYVINNYEALEALYRRQMHIKSGGAELPLNFRMNVAVFQQGQVDVPKKIHLFCQENFINNKLLRMSNVAEHEIFKNVTIDFSVPRVMSQFLIAASRRLGLMANCASLDLSNNNLTSLEGSYPMTWFTKLKHLDLSNNKLDSLDKLVTIPQGNKISSVKLAGNPLCNEISLIKYINGVKHYFNELERLDGCMVDGSPIFMSRQNFLAVAESYGFVETFLKHYFSDYDTASRVLLKEVYAPMAQFTISCNFDTSIKTSKDFFNRIAKYTTRGRNISKIIDMSMYYRNVFIGNDEILRTINDLHLTEHDFYSFSVDCPHYTVR